MCMEFKEWVGNVCSLSTLNGCNHDQNGAHRLHNNKRHQGEPATVDAHDIISLLCEHLNLRFMLHEPLKSHVPQHYETRFKISVDTGTTRPSRIRLDHGRYRTDTRVG